MDSETTKQVDQDAARNRTSESNRLASSVRWLLGGVFTRNSKRLAIIGSAQLVASLVAGFSSIVLMFYLRAIFVGGVGRFNINLGDLTSTRRVLAILGTIAATAVTAAFTMYFADRAITKLAMSGAGDVRRLLIQLTSSTGGREWAAADPINLQRLVRAITNQSRSASVATSAVLRIVQMTLMTLVMAAIAIALQPLITLIVSPILFAYALASRRLSTSGQAKSDILESRSERTRNELSAQVNLLADGELDVHEMSLTRVETDEQLFHDVLLKTSAHRTLAVLNGVAVFVTLIVYFAVLRSTDNFDLLDIMLYSLAARLAISAMTQVNRSTTMLSLRLHDIEDLHVLVRDIDRVRHHRYQTRPAHQSDRDTLTLDFGQERRLVIARDEPVIVLLPRPVSRQRVETMLRVLSESTVPQTDLLASARFVLIAGSDANSHIPNQDLVSDAEVRVIESDDLSKLNLEVRGAFTFIVHHTPKLLLRKTNRERLDELGGYVVFGRNGVVNTGDVEHALDNPDTIRAMRTRSKRSPLSTETVA